MNEVTQLLNAASRGEAHAAAQLLPLVYEELRRLAAGYLDQEKPGQTLQPAALVHEAYLRLVGHDVDAPWQGRVHFLATAALAMRHILIDHARLKKRDKRGGDRQRVELADHADPRQEEADRMLALDDALTRLAAADASAAELVHTFGGLSVEEAGKLMGLSRAAAYGQWGPFSNTQNNRVNACNYTRERDGVEEDVRAATDHFLRRKRFGSPPFGPS